MKTWKEELGIKEIKTIRAYEEISIMSNITRLSDGFELDKTRESIIMVVPQTFCFINREGWVPGPEILTKIEKWYLHHKLSGKPFDFPLSISEGQKPNQMSRELLEDLRDIDIDLKGREVLFFNRAPWETKTQTELATGDLVAWVYARFEFLILDRVAAC